MLGNIDPGWLWAIGGVLLLIAEVIAPGFFLVFIGAAAVATGLFTVLFDLGLSAQSRHRGRGNGAARLDRREFAVAAARVGDFARHRHRSSGAPALPSDGP